MTVRIGIVGAGFMGQLAHLSSYTSVSGCEIVALAEPQTRLRSAVARRYDIDETYDNHEALLSSTDVDGVVSALPYRRHEYVVPDILTAGLPLFTEKPLAMSVDTGEELAALAEEHDVAHMVGYHKRADPAMVRAKAVVDEWLDTGAYGDLRHVRVTMPRGDWVAGEPDPITTDEDSPDGDLESLPTEFDDAALEVYDELINYYVHQINALRFFLGDYEPTFADGGGRLLTVENGDGATGVLERSPYQTSDDWQESVLVGFDRGYVSVDLPAPLARQEAGTVEVMRDDEGTTRTRPTMPPTSAMQRQAEAFVEVVANERDPPCDSREAVADLRVARDCVRLQTSD